MASRNTEKSEIETDNSWKKAGIGKNRYSELYSNKRNKRKNEDEDFKGRISFMANDNAPCTTLLTRDRDSSRRASSSSSTSRYLTSVLSQQSDLGSEGSRAHSAGSTSPGHQWIPITQRRISKDLGGHETLLLDMVRAKSRELQAEAQDQTLALPSEDNESEDLSSETCIHGLSLRMTERSVSRSRFSRMSTRRDMDIPSILAFTTTVTAAPAPLEIPAFKKINTQPQVDIPRWSIRRAVCPVCSQKWRDKSSVNNIKYSGLKRNSSSDLPSVIAPGRIRTAITMGYIPRPMAVAVDREAGISHGGLRNTSATWQLTRARRFRTPKPQIPPPEANIPPYSAPLAIRDLDLRVNRFLTDTRVKA